MPRTVTCSPEVVRSVPAEASGETLADSWEAAKNREGWEGIINDRLVEWGRNPQTFDEDDLVPPTADAIRKACKLATCYRDDGGVPPALRVLPDGDGGIVFEWRHGEEFLSLEITPDEEPILNVFKNCKLVAELPVAM